MSDPEHGDATELSTRPLNEADLPLIVRWRNEPHVHRWWHTDTDPTPYTLADAQSEYLDVPETADTTEQRIIVLAGRPVGYVQWYRWRDYAHEIQDVDVPQDELAFGLDIFIGEPDLIGTGVGSKAVGLVCNELFAKCGASCVALLTAVDNERAQRAYEKAGFERSHLTLDTDVRDGRRVESWVMVRPP